MLQKEGPGSNYADQLARLGAPRPQIQTTFVYRVVDVDFDVLRVTVDALKPLLFITNGGALKRDSLISQCCVDICELKLKRIICLWKVYFLKKKKFNSSFGSSQTTRIKSRRRINSKSFRAKFIYQTIFYSRSHRSHLYYNRIH